MSQKFEDELIEVGARALCKKHERRSPDYLEPILPEHIDMRRKYPEGNPLWMKYRADAKLVIDAIFERNQSI